MKRVLLGVTFVAVMLSLMAFAGDKKDKKDDEASSLLSVTVTKETNGKPVKYAAVVLHAVDKDGRQSKGGIELKTNTEGKTEAPGIPYGKLRIQVIAKGFQTYGADIDVNQPSTDLQIKLKPPAEQYTIYK